MSGCPPSPAMWVFVPFLNLPPDLIRRLRPFPPLYQKALPTRTHSPPPGGSAPSHQKTVIVIPHEDQPQPGYHLQVATTELNEDPRLAEGQLDPVEESRDKVLRGKEMRPPSEKIPTAMCVTDMGPGLAVKVKSCRGSLNIGWGSLDDNPSVSHNPDTLHCSRHPTPPSPTQYWPRLTGGY